MIVANKPIARENQAMLEDQKQLASNFVAALIESGITPGKVAEACGITEQAVSNWKRTGKIDKKHLPVISRLTGWGVHRLLTGERDIVDHGPDQAVTEAERLLLTLFRELLEDQQAKVMRLLEESAEEARRLTGEVLRKKFGLHSSVPDEVEKHPHEEEPNAKDIPPPPPPAGLGSNFQIFSGEVSDTQLILSGALAQAKRKQSRKGGTEQ